MSATCVTLWIGDALGAVERACLRSMLRHGHKVALYCYRPVAGVPAEVEMRDAEAIVPRADQRMIGLDQPEICSDWFRYELLERGLGTWVDADMYLLRPLDAQAPYLFGEEAPGVVNNAVLRLPKGSPLLAELIATFRSGKTPRWLPWWRYLPLKARELLMGQSSLAKAPWGTTGPGALTAVLRASGLDQLAQPREVFYPVHWSEADWVRDPAKRLDSIISERSTGVHLWNYCIRDFKNLPAPEGSFLHRLQEEGG